jgi:hypothetical protein
MSKIIIKFLVPIFLVAIFLTSPLPGQTSTLQGRGGDAPTASFSQRDTASRVRLSDVEEVAKAVDSLQFIVVYNSELLKQDVTRKVIWIYVMLAVVIVATATMFVGLKQVQRQKVEMEERLSNQISATMAQMESHMKGVSEKVDPYHPRKPARIQHRRKRKS